MDNVQTPQPGSATPEEGTDATSRGTGAAPSVTRPAVGAAKRSFPLRGKLSEAQEREVTRLYAETTTPVSEIRRRFGIAESSVYRVAQRHGAALRGRTPASTQPTAPQAQPATVTRRRASDGSLAAPAVSAAQTESRATGAPVQARAAAISRPPVAKHAAGTSTRTASRGSTAARQPTASGIGAATSAGAGGARRRFRIRFQAEIVFEAKDMIDALRQAESRGATEVMAIVRED